MPGNFIVVMGVSGCGKSTLAKQLAETLSWQFIEADDFHSLDAKTQMAQGIGLSDAQRKPWLAAVGQHCHQQLVQDSNVVLACSALKRQYRALLSKVATDTRFIWIDVSRKTLALRLQQRSAHFARETLLDSQFAALEVPQNETNCIKVNGDLSSAELLHNTLEKLNNEKI